MKHRFLLSLPIVCTLIFILKPNNDFKEQDPLSPSTASNSISPKENSRKTRQINQQNSRALFALLKSGQEEDAARVLKKWLANDEEAALRFLPRIPTDPYDAESFLFPELTEAVSDHLDQQGYPNALEKIRIFEDQIRIFTPLAINCFENWNQLDSPSARTWLLQNPEIEGAELLAHISIEFIDLTKPTAILEELTNQPESTVRKTMIQTIFGNWIETEPIQASEFINQMEALSDFDEPIVTFVSYTAATHPEISMSWARSIFDPEQRQMAITEVLEEWKLLAPEELQTWIQAQESQNDEIASALAELSLPFENDLQDY